MRNLEVRLPSARLLLRPLQPGDAAAVLTTYADPEVVRYWSGLPWTDIAQADAYIARSVGDIADGSAMRLAVELADSGQFVGQVSLHQFDAQNRRCEIGYALQRAHWGHGYMDEALRTLLHFGFHALDLHRVEADIDPRNSASRRAVERQGFQVEGLLRERWLVGGEACDTVLYGLLRRDWLQLAAPQPSVEHR